MGHWVRADEKRCALCVLPRVHMRYIVVIVTCLKSLPCCFVETTSVNLVCRAYRTLSRQGVYCCNHIYVSCQGFHYCKNNSQVSANHLAQGVSLGRVVGKRGLYPYCRDHQSNVGSIHDVSGYRIFCHRTVSVPHIFNEFVHCLDAENPVVVHQPRNGLLYIS